MESIEIHLKAVGKPRMNHSDRWKIPAGRASSSVYAYIAFADKLRIDCRGFLLGDNVELEFAFSPPESWSNKKRLACLGQPHQQRPDCDNLIKSILDILRPGDDQSIHSISAKKIWAEKDSIKIKNRD